MEVKQVDNIVIDRHIQPFDQYEAELKTERGKPQIIQMKNQVEQQLQQNQNKIPTAVAQQKLDPPPTATDELQPQNKPKPQAPAQPQVDDVPPPAKPKPAADAGGAIPAELSNEDIANPNNSNLLRSVAYCDY